VSSGAKYYLKRFFYLKNFWDLGKIVLTYKIILTLNIGRTTNFSHRHSVFLNTVLNLRSRRFVTFILSLFLDHFLINKMVKSIYDISYI
jgi:hypothetical protein